MANDVEQSAGNRAVVIGGGIAGLAAAASLLRSGWHVQVLEAAGANTEVGAGLAVTENGRRALAAIDADGCLARDGYRISPAGTRAPNGAWLMKLSDSKSPSAAMYGLHRQRLHQALAVAASDAEVVTGARALTLEPGDDIRPAVVTARTSTGEIRLTADLVVGADGVRSRTRSVLWPEHRVIASGYTSWRAVIPDTELVSDRFWMTWGPRAEFGALRIRDDEVYWYAYVKHPADTPFPDELAAVKERFSDWHDDARSLIAATPADRLIRHDVWLLDHPLPTYASGRVVVIGDAAHPMLPTMGQGANSALEDGVSLGRTVPSNTRDIPAALRAYDLLRRPRTAGLVARSAFMARLGAHLGPGLGQPLRNLALRLTPAGAAQRAGSGFLDWTVPPLGSAQE